ncbi:hypothetical protein DJ535_14165 [Citrobacter murliniae]|uniref:Uncharacterized protein n=1 Tax=Citrobacter murliniae TaxID=67829 RepID=A0ABY2PUY4_9ENTR|nr:hypothetical protein DJ535_14165 [Citrobacter murliniae]
MPGLFALPPCHSPQLSAWCFCQTLVVILLQCTVLLLRDSVNRKRLSSRAVTVNNGFVGVYRSKMDKKVAFFRSHKEPGKPDSDHVMKKNNNFSVHFAPFLP